MADVFQTQQGTTEKISTTTLGYPQLQYRSGTISVNLGGGGHNWLGPIVPSTDCELPS